MANSRIFNLGSYCLGLILFLASSIVFAATFTASPSPSSTGNYNVQWSGATSGIVIVSEVVNGVNRQIGGGSPSGSIPVTGKSPGRYTYILEQKTPGAGSGFGAPTQTTYADVASPTPTVSTPTISPNGGTFASAQTVTLSTSPSDATIRYTTNGSAVTESSPAYSSSFVLSSSATLRVKAFKSGYNASGEASTGFTINIPTVSTPTISPNGGTFTSAQTVSLSTSTSGATIRYTTNGSSVTASSPAYSSPFVVSGDATVKARAFKTGFTDSGEASAGFTIRPPAATPTISPNGGTFTSAQTVSLSTSTSGATIRYTTNGSSVTASSPAYSSPFVVSSDATVKARAFKTGFTDSGEVSAGFTINIPASFSATLNPSTTGNYNLQWSGATFGVVVVSEVVNGVKSSVGGGASSGSIPITGKPSGRYTYILEQKTPGVGSGYGAPTQTIYVDVNLPTPTVSTPTISPNGGTFTSAQTVTLGVSPSDATIRYTTNGSAVTESSLAYSSPFVLSSSATLRVKAFKSGYNASGEASTGFTINIPTVSTPTISPNGGTFTSAQTVTLGASPSDATIRYTTNGSAVTTSSPTYSGTFTVGNTSTIKAKAFKTGYNDSGEASASFTINVPTVIAPVITPNGGEFIPNSTAISIASSSLGAIIRYTTDGSTVTASSPLYVGAFTLASNATVKAKAFKANYLDSEETTAIFTKTTALIFTANPSPSTTGSYVINWDNANAGLVQVSEIISGTKVTLSGGSASGSSSVSGKPDGRYEYVLEQLTPGVGSGQGAAPKTIFVDVALPVNTPRVETPSIIPSGTEFSGSTSVHLNTNTNGATVRYTLNNTPVTNTSSVFTNDLTINETTTFRAKAFKAGMIDSEEVSAVFTKIVGVSFTASPSPSATGNFDLIWSNATTSITELYDDANNLLIRGGTSGSFSVRNKTTGTYQYTLKEIMPGVGSVTHIVSVEVNLPITETVADPVVTPNGGSFTSATSVTAATVTTGATVRYTTDGSSVTENSPIFPPSLTFYNPRTLKTKAFKTGFYSSAEKTSNFSIVIPGQLNFYADPASPSSTGNYDIKWENANSGRVEVSEVINGTKITLDMNKATGSVSVTGKQSGQYHYILEQFTPGIGSGVGAPAVNLYVDVELAENLPKVAAPLVDIKGRDFYVSQEVRISSSTPDAVIRYTTNGAPVSATSTEYKYNNGNEVPITITNTTTLKVKAFKTGYINSDEVTEIYTKKVGFGCSISPSISTDGNFVLSWNNAEGLVSISEVGSEEPLVPGSIANGERSFTKTFSDRYEYTLTEIKPQVADPVVHSCGFVDVILKPQQPKIEPHGGVYFEPVNVKINNPQSDATAFYTLDGSDVLKTTDPSSPSKAYSAQIIVSKSLSVKAKAFINTAAGESASEQDEARFIFIEPIKATPVQSEDGNFTLTWNSIPDVTPILFLSERLNDGSWGTPIDVTSLPNSKSFIGKATGAWSYRLDRYTDCAAAIKTECPKISTEAVTVNVVEESPGSGFNSSSSYLIQAEDYSSMVGVAIEATTDVGGGKNVGWIDPGDAMVYANHQVNILEAGTYKITYRLASPNVAGRFDLIDNESNELLNSVTVPQTGGYQTWTNVESEITLSKGVHTFAINSLSRGFNINWFKIESVSGKEFGIAVTKLPYTIEAEDYSSMVGVGTEITTDVGGGKNVAYLNGGDSITYANKQINIPITGVYKFIYRAAGCCNAGKFNLIDHENGSILDTVTTPVTGGWQSWTNVEREVTLTKGMHTFSINILAAGFNLNWFRIESIEPAGTVSAPSITPNGGAFQEAATVELKSSTANATIYYSLDNSDVTETSLLYTQPFELLDNKIVRLKAKAFKPNWESSPQSSAIFNFASGSVSPEKSSELVSGDVADPADDSAPTEFIGTVGGQFRVSESGSATYNVPIKIAEGIAGVTPQFSLGYSSQSPNGLLGQGWSLSGASSINRCRQTLMQDGQAMPITWSEEDRFCLDGQRLILTFGSYGFSGSTYKTEIDTYVKITAVGGVAGHPDSFKVEAKDGSVSYYGVTSDAKFSGSTNSPNTTILSWAINRFEDNVGNAIQYVYEGDNTTGQRLATVNYAFASGVPQASVTFAYTDRLDTTSAYVAGYEFKQTKRLSRVTAKNSGSELRHYELEYLTPIQVNSRYQNNVSHLDAILECKGTVCLPATSFQWGGGSHMAFDQGKESSFISIEENRSLLNNLFVDVNGDGKTDSIYLTFESALPTEVKPYQAKVAVHVKYADLTTMSLMTYTVDSAASVQIRSLDYNADGRQDLAFYNNNKWTIYLSDPKADGTWKIDGLSPVLTPSFLTDPETVFVDINSDGLADAVTGKGYRLLERNSMPNTSNTAYSFSTTEYPLNWDLSGMNEILEPLPEVITGGGHNCIELGQRKKILPESIADFNGDGIADFIGVFSRTVRCSIAGINDTNTLSLDYLYAVTKQNDTLKNYSGSALSKPKYLGNPDTKVLNADVNGDGLTDIVTYVKDQLSYHINNGIGFNAPEYWVTLSTHNNNYATPQLIDFNGDGGIDVVWNDANAHQLKLHLWGETDPLVSSVLRSTEGDENASHFLMDITGDAILDYIQINSGGITSHRGVMAISTGPIPVDGSYGTPVSEEEQQNAIIAIDNGLGNVTRIHYGTLSNSGRYSTTDVNLQTSQAVFPTGCPESYCPPSIIYTVTNADEFYNRLNGGWDLPTGSTTLIAGNQSKNAPVLEVNGSMSVVTFIESSAPTAGNSPRSVNLNATSKVEYYYGEAKMQASGRGFLGFNKLKTVDTQTGITTVSTYRQDFPFIGRPLTTVVYEENSNAARILSRAVNDWVFATPSGQSKLYEVALHKATEESYDLVTGSLLQTTKTTTLLVNDGTGNVDSVILTTTGADQESIQSTKNEYHPSEWDKRMGRLASTTVITQLNGVQDSTKTVSFEYWPNGLLRKEIFEQGTAEELITEYIYDTKGNKTEISVTSSESQKTRTTINKYDDNGRYLVSTTNDLSQKSEIVTRDPLYGFPTTVKGIDGNRNAIYYDSMGAEYLQTNATGGWTRVESKRCNSGICPNGAQFFTLKTMSGGARTTEYFDSLGRTIRSSKVGFNGIDINVDTEYDNLGRIRFQSMPYYNDSSPAGWNKIDYDILGRVVKTTSPDGTYSTSSYNDYGTDIQNAEGQHKLETRNGLGQLVEVQDELGGKIQYTYNHQGNLLTATTLADNKSVTVKMCYDRLGRKTAMLDPDKGGFKASSTNCPTPEETPLGWWTYKYNAFGELTDQRDAKGQTSHMEYDQIGRMVKRTDKEANGAIDAHTRWYFDKDIEGNGSSVTQGKLMTVVMSMDGSEHCSGSNHCTTYSYDNAGRLTDSLVLLPNDATGYISSIRYDALGRPFEEYDALNGNVIGTSGVQTQYNDYGYAYRKVDIAPVDGSSGVLSEIKAMNEAGQVTEEYRGNGLTSVNTYDTYTGFLERQFTASALQLSAIQDNTYQWDSIGNLKSRLNKSANVGGSSAKNNAESFCYDNLNRLIKTESGIASNNPNCSGIQDTEYDGFGNITYKKGVGNYTYGSNAGPHAVTGTATDGSYGYDNNGNQISGAGRELYYTSYDMVKRVTKAGNSIEFSYGPGRDRWQRKDVKNGVTTTTTYLGAVERIESGNSLEWKRSVGGVVFTYTIDLSTGLFKNSTAYLYGDHLGSTDVITDALGTVTHAMSFDAWGSRRNGENWTENFYFSELSLSGFIQPITQRGFTGHEMLDDMGIIHMNGRIYDSRLGRFLQADPIVDGATNTQGYNRYSYLHNNPLNAMDPSGFSAWTTFRDKILKPIIQAVVSYYCAPCGAWLSAATTAYYGGSLSQIGIAMFSSYIMGGASAGVAGGVGFGFNWATLGYAVLGGVTSAAQGGKFKHGFISAGLGSIANAKLGPIYNANGFSVPGLIASAVIGGTISELSGGKFANGAQSAAMNYAVQWGASKIDTGGQQPEPASKSSGGASCTSGNPINIATGEKYLTMVDYQAEGASQMTFERYYSSYAGEKTSLGIGWRSNFDRSLQLDNVGDVTLRVVADRHQGDPIMFNWISDESADGGHWETDGNRYESIRKTDSGWELQLTNNSREIYNAEGRLIAIKQIDGYEQTLVYGNQGTVKNVLLSVTDNFGQQLQFAYDLQARMTSMTATDGSVTRYEYDAVDNLAKVISPDETPADDWDNSYVVYDYDDKRFSHAITGIRNSQGQRIHSMAYDDSGRAVLSALGDDAERVDMVFSTGENHTKTTSVKNSLGKFTEYTFNQQNKPLVVDGQPTATCIGANQGYDYNEKGQLTSKTDWNGSTTRYEYNDRGLETLRVEAVGTAEERNIETQWHAQWRLPVQVTAAGLVVEFDYNNAGQLIQRMERDISVEVNTLQKILQQYPERVWNYGYNAQGLLQSVDGPRTDVQDVTEFEYDANGNRTAVINALAQRSEVLAVNERGLPEQVRDANGVVTMLAYNARGWLTSKTMKSDKGDSTTHYHYSGISDYDNQGLISSVTLPNGEEITYEYDSARRLVAQHNKAGERLEYSLDLEGNRTEQRIYNATGALTFSQAQVFDELSRLLASIGADGNAIGYGYDKAGNRTSTTDALGHNTSYAYDALNRLIATSDALDGAVKQTYDDANRVTSITDQRDLTTQYRYNGFGNKIAQISPDTGETQYGYDEAGNLVSKTDARGVVTEYRYDVLGRVTDVIYPAANDENIHYGYDDQQQTNSVGRVSHVSDASGEQVYSYNQFGQVSVLQSQIGVTRYNQAYDYDRNGQLVSQQYPSGRRVSYHYDAQGRLATVDTEYQDRSESVLTQMRHQPFGPLATLGYGNGTQLEIGQDNNYRIRTQQLLNAANDALYHRGYEYDANSNIVGITDYNKPAANQVFVYDALSRLTDATGNYGTLGYGYDAVGNRISRTQNNRLEDYAYAENSNRLLSVTSEGEQGDLQTRTLAYDAVGNITSDSANLNAKILGFGANNRLEQVTISNGNTDTVAAYQYNAKGQRVVKHVDGKTIHFHYDTENRLLAETTETGTPIRDYIYAANQRIALVDYQQNTQGVVYFMVNDHLGTPQLLLDAQQQVVWSVDQSPFGEVKVEGSVEQPLRFPGQYADVETGYSYNYFRDYDPTLGRYIESDPIGLEAGVNTFGYVTGNPVGAFDLYGLAGFGDIWNAMTSGVSYDNVYQARQAAFISTYSRARTSPNYVTGSLVYKEQSPFSFGYRFTTPSEMVLDGRFRDLDGFSKSPSYFDGAEEIIMSVSYRPGQPDSYYSGFLDTAQDIANNSNLPVGIRLPNDKNTKWLSPNACPVEFNVSYSF
jgi:RHS repeat-associated protein